MKLLFVCLGNICRSPTAEAVMAHQIEQAGLDDLIVVDSAGTGDWHIGSAPDARAASEADSRGVTMRSRARQVNADDFDEFDLILAMDAFNLRDLQALAPNDAARSKIHLLREFDPDIGPTDKTLPENDSLDVPDPYFGGPDGFTHAFDLVDSACKGLLEEIRSTYLEQT